MDDKPAAQPQPKKPKSRAKLAIVILIILLLTAGAGIGWLLWQNNQQSAKFNQEQADLQARFDELKRAGQDPAIPPSDDKPCCDGTVAQSTKDAIRTAITNEDFAPLEALMADSVRFVLAASEYGPTVTPAQALVDLRRLNSATTPWDFNLPAGTISAFDSGDYGDYFEARSFVARSADGMVVSFNFDNCGKINGIFVAASL